MMHLPLLLVQDSVLKTKTPWPKLTWLGEDGGRVCSISRHLVGEVDLSSGSCSKVAKLTPFTKTTAAISATSDGVFVYGILSSGDLFFWHTVTNQVRQAKGIPEVVTHTTFPSDSNVMRDFLKQLLPQNFGSNVASDAVEQTTCPVPAHHRPKIFASPSCSKVVVVLRASQIYVWERSSGSRVEESQLSQHAPGSWSVVHCPGDVSLPSTHSKETQISCCFMCKENSEECLITFTFLECLSVVTSTLTLRWRGSRFHPPAAHWNSKLVSFSALGVQENELQQVKGILISSYAHGQSILAVAVNSWKQYSKLLYIHPLCNTAVATSIQDVVPHCRSSNKCNARSQWVSDLAWSHDALYLFGCLTSGALFVATRMGPLIKISCQGEGIHLQAANILGMQPNSIVFTEEMGEEEGNKSPGGLPSITFTISPHPNKHQILLSSGLRVSVLSLPLDGRKEGEVVDCLLASATHALHLLCNSAVTHDYAYIRDSTWRLAHSVLDLTQGLDSTSSSNPPNISLWDRRVVVAADNAGSQERTPGDDGELMIEQVMKPLMAAWALIGSRSEAHTLEWKRRANEVVMVMTKLMATLLRITTHDDHLEHQLQVLLVLHFYHQFVRVLCLWPDSFYMLRPTLQLTHRLLHSVLACERHAGEKSMVSTLLILSQTLSTLEHSLTQAFKLRPALLLQAPSKARKVLVDGDVEASDLILSSVDDGMDQHEINSTVSLRMKNIWQCLYGNAKKVYSQLAGKKFDQESYQKSLLVLNILQDKLQSIGCDFDQRIMKLGRCHQLYLDGLYLKAIQSWKLEIIACLIKGHGKKVVCQDLHSILYASFVHEGSLGISRFINWLDDLLRSLLCPKKHSSLLNSPQMSATKDKSDEMELPFEYSKVNQIPKMEGTNEAAAKEDSEEIKVSLMRKLLCKEVNCDNRVHTFSPVEETSSQKHIEISRVPWIISAARQVMGSLGRLLALETLGYCPDVPPPHRPHVIPPLWTFTTQPQGKVHQLPTKRGAAVTGEWPVDAAAQALALAGCWADLAIFASWLDDAKMALVAGVLTTFGDNRVPVPSTVLPFYQIKALLCQPINSTVAEFHNHQELLQLAAMANLEVLPVILEECLAKMKELIPLFETFVPSQIHLPAPPMFCPLGPQDGEELLFHGALDNSQSERRLRQEVGGWVRLTCQVTSAAGIAYPLLLSLQQKYSKLPLMGSEDLSNLVEALGCHQECWQPQGPEWERITWLWHQVVTLVWVLYSRDRLSLGIRSLVRNASAVQQNQDLEMCILEILSWVHELNTLCEHDSWRTELVACAVTAASEAPPVPAVAAALARVMPQPSLMPSLMKDKAERLFVTWKSTSIAFSEVEPHFKRKENETEDISSPDVFTSLFSFYQDRCEEIVKHLPSEEEKMETLSYINKCPTKFSNGISVAARIQEEFEKFLFLFVELTFMRDVQKFPQYISSVPLLVQFSDVLRRREFEGIKLKNKLHHDDTGSITSSVKHNILNSPSLNTMNPRSSVSTSEKKGLFRSIDYSKMLPRGSETIFVSSGKRHVTTTPTNTQSVNMVLHNIGKENLIKPKMSSPSRRKLPNLYLPGRRSRSLSRQKKRPVPVPRPRSLSVSGGRRTQQQRSSRQYSEPLHWNTSQKSNSSIKDLLLQRLLHLPRCLGYNTKQVEVDETIKLLHWMMRRERQFDFSVVESDSYIVRRLARNVKFTLDDVMLSVMWNDLPRYLSHMKNEKSYPEIENKKLKKKKKKEKGRQRTESVHVVPYNKHVASDDHSTVNQEEMLQAISSAGCPTRQQNTTPINTPSKGMECISEESNGVEIRDEQLCAELNAEGISNSYLTQMDQDKEIDDKENVQNDSESENCLSSPHDLPYEKLKSSLVDLSGSVDVQNHNIDSIINSSKDGERQDMKRSSKENSDTTATPCEDQDPHQHNHSPVSQVTSLSKTFKKRRKTSETLPVSFQAVELEQEDTDPDIRTTDQNNSRSENLSSDVSPSFKINPKNWSRGHQVEVHVHAKKAKQSVPCRLPILSAPHRANMTGVEAPEESFDPGVIRFGHLLHLSPDTPSVSKMLVPADASVGKNTRPTKPDQGIPEDTLDDITLPDSLHASDLEEQNESSASSQNMHDNIIKKNRYRSVSEKSRDRGTGLYVPLRVKKSVTNNDPHHWDCRDLNLKPVTLQVKSAHKATLRDEVNTSISEKHTAHMKENSNAKKSLKLLTLPKLSPLKKCDDKQEKSLQLKLLPIDDGFKNTAKEKRKNQNVITNTWLHPVEKKAEHMKPLTIPRFFDSAHNDDRKGNDLNFINPHQVFAFYRQSALKRHTEKFKKLQVSKKYLVSSEQPHAEPLISIERKEKKIPGEVAENIDRGFLDQVKDYADKYRKGGYENILRNDKEVNEKEITVYYKPTDDKKMIDKSTQDDPHLTKEDKPVESIQNPSDMRDAFGSNKTHSFALKDNVLEREKKCENRSVNTDPYEMRQKTMKASSVQTGGLDGDRASALSSKSAVQTQTAALQTVDASVLTDSAVFGKSESVQVGSLLPSPPPPPPLKTKQPSPPPQSAVLPPQPSPSYTAPTHNSRPPSETGSAHHFLHTFDTPSETVKEELKDMEMNRTALSLDVGKSDQYVVHGLFDIGEKRKAEEYPKITNSDYNEESSLQKQTADHILDGTTRNDVREHRLLSHTAQNLCNDKKLYKAAPVSSVTITTDVLVKNMTMDNLYEEFCSGRISLEDFYLMSSNIPEDERKKESLQKIDNKGNILTLEQQVLEAAQSISESQHLMEKVKCLIQEPEAAETDTHTSQNCKSDEKFLNHSHRHQNSMAVARISKDVAWQEALSVYKNHGKVDSLLRFLEAADFENVTSAMINEIIQCENSIQSSEARKASEQKVHDDILLGHKNIDNITLTNNKILPRIKVNKMSEHKGHCEMLLNSVDTDTTGSGLLLTQDRMNLLSSRTESQELHLSSPFIRSPDTSCFSSLGSLLGESTSSLDHEEKIQKRRKEIRVWIKKQRQKRQEQAKANLSVTFTKPRLIADVTPATSRDHSSMTDAAAINITHENSGLTGKQLQERRKDREVKRARQREINQKKREADIVKLLNDHKEEATMYQSHVKPKLVCESSPKLTKFRKLQELKSNFNRNSHLSKKLYGSREPKSVHGFVCHKKPELNRYFKNSKEEWRKSQQHNQISSPLSQHSSEERGQYCVETSIEDNTSLQMEFYYLKKCLDNKNKEKHRTGIGTKEKQEPSMDEVHFSTLLKEEGITGKYIPSHPKLVVSKEGEASSSESRDSSLRHSLPLNATFTIPLDRISEVASNLSETSSQDHQEGDGATVLVSAGEDTSTDSSWNVPEEIRNLLYSSQ
ncbi:uncharacterized protein LOC135111554 isoform X2 [Scylla paramamosain]|uniref:uncharacterized protein LOC135111554 isoform X2 n=1 Tax=Scylla paramamosain TaxID=85552 RepID=UPI003083D8AF